MMTREALQSDAVAAFGVFAKHLNFTRAAAELHIAQPSLHAKITKLAGSLETALYERVGRGLRLTDAGERLVAFARDADRHVDEFLADLGAPSTRVTIAAGRAALLWVLGDSLRKAVRVGADLRVVAAGRDTALALVRTGDADVAAIAYDPPPRDLRQVRIGEYPQVLLVPRSHRLATRSEVRIRDLEHLRLVVPPPGRPHRQTLERALGAEGVEWSPATEADGWDVLVHLASIGLGAAVVNGCVPAPRSLVAIPIRDLPKVAYWLAWRAARASSVDLILDHLDGHA